MKLQTRELAKMAMYIALYIVIDIFSSRVLKMPNGGSLGLATIVLMLASFDLGVVKALIVTFGGLVIGFLFDPPVFVSLVQFVLEYFVAYGIYAFAKVFKTDKFLITSVLIPNAVRLAIHVISGMIYFGVNFEGSVAYNSPYMIATAVAGIVILPILVYKLQPMFDQKTV